MAFSSYSNNSLASGTVLWNNCSVAGNIDQNPGIVYSRAHLLAINTQPELPIK